MCVVCVYFENDFGESVLGAVLLFIPCFWISCIHFWISIAHLWISLIELRIC